jgi:hypothetical protein
MTRVYTTATIKKLFTLSGNICAFPGCNTKMIDDDFMIIAQICHIQGEREGSARYNPDMTEEQRRSFDNLILLCPTHHTTIDANRRKYTTGYLTKIKPDHENRKD